MQIIDPNLTYELCTPWKSSFKDTEFYKFFKVVYQHFYLFIVLSVKYRYGMCRPIEKKDSSVY